MRAEPPAWRWTLIAIFALALLIRIPPLFAVTIWYDEAVEGLMSQNVLRGRFPIFFYGQPVHGAADRYLAALAILLLGPTPVALKLPMLALFFVFLGSIAYTTRRIFGPQVATLAALFVAVPPYYFFGWNFDSRGHYVLMLILGVWLLFLAWRTQEEGVTRTPRRRIVGLGFLAGVCWWTNYLSITFLAPIALALALQGLRALRGEGRRVLARGALALGAFAVGVAPMLGYYLGHRLPLRPPGSAVGSGRIAAHAVSLAQEGLPPILGVHPDVWRSAYGAGYATVAAIMLGSLLYGGGCWLTARRPPGARRGTVGFLLGVVLITVLLSMLTQYGAILRYPRYLLPLYLALPVFFGLALDRLGGVARPLKWLLAGAVLLNNLLGSLQLTPVLAAQRTVERQRQWALDIRRQLEFLAQHGLRHLYGGWNHWTFLSDQRVLASDPYRERMAEVAQEVDAAEEVAWVFGARTAAFEASAAGAGIGFQRLDGPGFVAYTGFTVPATAYADIEPNGWSATASHRAEDAALAHDRSLSTVWSTRARQGPGQFYQLDLGGRRRVGLVAWMPSRYRETPGGFKVSVSTDARHWREVADVPAYYGPLFWSGTHPFQRVRRGRVEVRFPPIEGRHVRIELTAPGREFAWSMRELVVGTPVGECPRRYDPGALVRVLRDAGVRVVYADHWLSANIAKLSGDEIRVLPSNLSVNSYRLERPDADTIESIRITPGRGIVIEECPTQTADALASMLRESGVRFARRAVAGFVAFTHLESVPYTGIPVASRISPARDKTLAVDLRQISRVSHVVVHCQTPMVSPIFREHLGLEASDDGQTFVDAPFRLVQRGKLRMSGSRVFRDLPSTIVLEMSPRPVALVRVTKRAGQWEWCPIARVLLVPAG